MRLIMALLAASLISTNLTACFPIVAGGAAAGTLVAADRRTSGAYLEDQSIAIKAENRIKEKLGDKIHVNANSFNRNVLLTGEAIDEASKETAGSIVKAIENVRNVTNELSIGSASSVSSRSSDVYLASKVKARMISENKFPAIYVKVTVENSVAYLMGLVTHKEANDATEITRSTDGIQKVVKVFEYIDAQ